MAVDINSLDPINSPSAPVEDVSFEMASQWRLMWWKFKRHKLAMLGALVTFLIYFIALFAEFFAPFAPEAVNARYTFAPPQGINLFLNDENGLQFYPHVFGYSVELDPVALRRTFVIDPDQVIPLQFFAEGEPYKVLGLIESNLHFVGPVDSSDPMYILGADRLGRDMTSRIIHGTRISMSIGLIGVLMSFLIGIFLGGLSGYYGGWVDNIIQRTIEFLRSIPTIPLWMGLAAALPLTWHPLQVYFGITVILSLIGWTSLARVVRGRFLSLRNEDFVMAARLDGSGEIRIIWLHMVPSFFSHIIAALTLAIPQMILAETSLSFLGLGLRRPIISWGVLLQEAQNIRSVATAPWLLLPGLAVVIAVLALNFFGDGIRDAADPYSQ